MVSAEPEIFIVICISYCIATLEYGGQNVIHQLVLHSVSSQSRVEYLINNADRHVSN